MEKIETRLSDLENRVKLLEQKLNATLSQNSTGVKIKQNKSLSMREFLNTKELGDDVDRSLAIAYWLDFYDDVEVFNAADIGGGFRTARFTVPKNVNDKINMNIRNGHFAEAKEKKDGKKAYYITNSGINYLEKEINYGEK